MKKTIAFLLASVATCFAQPLLVTDPAFRAQQAAAGPTDYLREDFESTGIETGWGEYSAVFPAYWDYATSPAPLAGTQSWLGTNKWSIGRSTNSVTASGHLFGFYLLSYPDSFDDGVNGYQMRILNGSTSVGFINCRGDGKIYYAAGSSSSAGSTITTGTVYSVWWEWQKGTGANAIMRVWLTNGSTVKPASPSMTLSNGNATLDANIYTMSGCGTNKAIVDNVLVGPSEYGNSPF